MPRPTNTDERRAQIARGLRAVMARQGYDGASIADVAAAAGLAPGIVHYHFASKLEILLAVLADLDASHEAALDGALAGCAGPIEAVRELIRFHLALDRADPETLACWVTLGGEALRQPRVRKAFAASLEKTTRRLAGIIRRGAAARVFRCARPDAAAAALVASIQGYFVLAATAPGTIPRGSAASAVLRMATGLLAPSRPLDPRSRP